MSFNPCHDCGTSYALLVMLALLWAIPIVCVVMRRHVGPQSDQGKRLKPVAWAFGVLAILASWRYITSWWL